MASDRAYYYAYGCITPQSNPRSRMWLPAQERDFNKDLLSVRIAVEQSFSKMETY